MSELTDFLLARIAEDEGAASRAGSFTPWTEAFQNDNYGHLTIQPDRVLAECEAKRRIVNDLREQVDHDRDHFVVSPQVESVAMRTLASLALPYADHPDYREEWRP